MKRARTKIVAGVVLLAGLIAVAGIVVARSATTTVEGYFIVGQGSEGKWWDSGPITHCRGSISVNGKWYDNNDVLIGTSSGLVNVNWDMVRNGDGEEWGTLIVDLTPGGLGTFEGRFHGKITDWYVEGHAVMHGTGDSAGLIVQGSYCGHYYEAFRPIKLVILDPHGE